ncbi:MAG: TolC family protein [Rikenellaceae bacterium]
MNKILKLLSLTTFIFAANTIAAQPITLTLEQCRALAIQNNFNLKSSNEKILASEDIYKACKTNNLPNFSLSANYIYSTATFNESVEGGYLPTFSPDMTTGEMVPNIAGYAADGTPIFSSYAYMPDIPFNFEIGSVYNAGLMVTQPIYMGGKVKTATELAFVGVDVANIEHKRTFREVMVEADEAFYTYLKVEEMLKAANSYKKVVDEFHRQVENLLKRGMCTKNELMKVKVRVNEAELMQLKTVNGVSLARMNLCYALGFPLSSSNINVVDTFDFQKVVDSNLDVSARPEFELLEKSVEAKELEVKLAKSDFRPSVSAIANYGYLGGMKLNNQTLLGSASFSGGVMVSIPIFHWGEGRRKISAAQREVAIAQNSQSDLVQKMTLELLQSINNYNEAQLEVDLMQRSLEQAQENLRQSGKQYEVGMETMSDYLEAQALWQKAMSDLIEAKSNQRLAYTHYCRCKGDKLQ